MKNLIYYTDKIYGLIQSLRDVQSATAPDSGKDVTHSACIGSLIQYLEYLSIDDFLEKNNPHEDAKEIDGLRSRLFIYENYCDDLLRMGLLSKEYTNLSEQLFNFYNELLEDFKPSNRYLFNLDEYRKVRNGERRFDYLLVNYPTNAYSSAPLPQRVLNFVAREKDTIDILEKLAEDSNPSLCISGKDYGDENAGVGKTVLATEIADIITAGRPITDYGYLDEHAHLVAQIRERYCEGVIWISLHSYKKNREEYFRLIAEAIGVPFFSKETSAPAPPPEEAQIQLPQELKLQLIQLFSPLFPNLTENSADHEVIDAVKTALKNEWVLDAHFKQALEAIVEPPNLKNKRGSSDKTAELFEAFSKNENRETVPLPSLSEEQLAAMEEERERRAHTRIDSLEKLAFILSSRKMLLVLDNAEQDRKTFEYIYARLRGFIAILVTCRVPLPGIPTHPLYTFTPEQAMRFFQTQSFLHAQYPELVLESIFRELNYNPYCLSILANNLKTTSLEEVNKDISNHLIPINAPTTVDRIIAVIDATKALSEEEKKLLFDASIFFKEHFSPFELSCYDPDRTQSEVEGQLQILYAEKRLVLIHQEAEKDTDTARYRLHESVRRYLRKWFEAAKDIQGKSKEEVISLFSNELEVNLIKNIEKNPVSDQRTRRYIENIRLINFLETPNGEAFQWKESYWSHIVWEYANEKSVAKSDFFCDIGMKLEPKDLWYMQMVKVSLACDEYNWNDMFDYFARWSREKYVNNQETPFVPYASSSLRSAFSILGIFDGMDFTIHEALFKLRNLVKGNNLLVSLSNFDNYNDKLVTTDVKSDIIRRSLGLLSLSNQLEYDWEFKINEQLFTHLMTINEPTQAEYYRNKVKDIVSKYYDTPTKQKKALAKTECHWAVFQKDWPSLSEYTILLETSDNDRLLFEIESAIAQLNFDMCQKLLQTLIRRGTDRQHIKDCTDWHYYTAKYYLSKKEWHLAVEHAEQALLNTTFYNLPTFREKALKQEIIKAIDLPQYTALLPSNLVPETFLPEYLMLPDTITDVKKQTMRLIPTGRVIKEDKKVFLPDELFLQQKSNLWLSETFNPMIFSTFSEDTMLYSFYVDEEPVTESDFREFFSTLPEHERQEYPEFNAENVLRYAQAQQKQPLTEIEWMKLYRGINYNIGDHYLNQHPQLHEPLYESYLETFKASTSQEHTIEQVAEWITSRLPEDLGTEKFSTVLPLPQPLITAIAYSVTLDKAELKLKLLRQLIAQNDKQLNLSAYRILRNSILNKISDMQDPDQVLEAELTWVSQKNLWRIALKYFIGIEKEFNILPSGTWKEAVVVYDKSIPKLVIKDTQQKMWAYKVPHSSSDFVPFRCMRLAHHDNTANELKP